MVEEKQAQYQRQQDHRVHLPMYKAACLRDCACPTCTDFAVAVAALHRTICISRKRNRCNDPHCAAWAASCASSSVLLDSIVCGKTSIPQFTRKSGAVFETRLPGCSFVGDCGNCGFAKKMAPPGSCFSDEPPGEGDVAEAAGDNIEGKNNDKACRPHEAHCAARRPH